MKKLLLLAFFGFALVPGYLLLKPTPVDPVAWAPPAAPKLEGPYAINAKLAGIQRLAAGPSATDRKASPSTARAGWSPASRTGR